MEVLCSLSCEYHLSTFLSFDFFIRHVLFHLQVPHFLFQTKQSSLLFFFFEVECRRISICSFRHFIDLFHRIT